MRSEDLDAELVSLRAAFDKVPLAPPAGWDAVRAFESAHAVLLPEPFRSFVATVGNGCAPGPPHYGLAGLDHLMDPVEEEARRSPDALARPFPLTAAWLWEDDPHVVETPGAALEDGTVYLGTDGCAMDWRLVVTGEHRGHIWHFTDVGALPFGRLFGYTTAEPGFGGWVRHWAAGHDWFDASA